MSEIYNLSYYEKTLRLNSKTAEKISDIRWDFVKCINPKLVLDYGSGVGWFRAFRPEGVEVDTYDIYNVPQTGINHKKYDLITLWDVLEHIPEPEKLHIWDKTKYVAITIPCVPGDKDIKDWKHYKPGEHLHYWNKSTINIFFLGLGFKNIKVGFPECPPRTDIITVLYEKINS